MSRKFDWREKENAEWNFWMNDDGSVQTDRVQAIVLLDIREELKKLNQLLNCPNFLSVPTSLRVIRRNTTKKKRTR